MGQPRGPRRWFARGNNIQCGAHDDDNFVTARGQPQRNNGYRSGYSGESHRNRRGHAALSSETPESKGISIHRRSDQKGQKPASTDKICEKAGLGRHQSLVRTKLVQHSEPTTCPRGLPTHRRKNRHSLTTTTDST